MDQIFKDLTEKADRAIEYAREELMSIRTGKASPAIVEGLAVLTYGGTTKLKVQELATVAVSGPSTLTIHPYDVSTIQDIEKAILSSPLNLTPRVDNKTIHITIPSLSEEQRKHYQKLVAVKIEEGKVRVRAARDESRRHVKQLFEDKSLTEDEKFSGEKELDKITQDYTTRLEEMKEKKDRELMEV